MRKKKVDLTFEQVFNMVLKLAVVVVIVLVGSEMAGFFHVLTTYFVYIIDAIQALQSATNALPLTTGAVL